MVLGRPLVEDGPVVRNAVAPPADVLDQPLGSSRDLALSFLGKLKQILFGHGIPSFNGVIPDPKFARKTT